MTKIVGLLRFGFHNTGWGDGLIWCKDKVQKTVLLFLLNRDGEYVRDWEVKGNRLKYLEQFKEEAITLSKERFGDINEHNIKHIVSFSGGKDSTAMLLKMIENNMLIDDIIFLDTTVEFPEMYEHISKVEKYIGRTNN